MRFASLTMVIVLACACTLNAQIIGTNIDTTTVTDGGPPYIIESLTVGSFSISGDDLVTGLVTGIDNTGTFNGTWPPPFTNPGPAGNLDINDILAKNDPEGTANPIDFTDFGQSLGVTSGGNWKGTNGSDPDFFIYEAAAATGDLVDVQAILPGGVMGRVMFLPLTNEWGDTELNRVGDPNNGQSLVGLAFSVQELKDQNGNNLSATAELEGIRVLSDTVDIGTLAAVNPGVKPLELDVNTTTGNISISNPNATSYTMGLNFYRITSDAMSLNNDTWNSLNEQEGDDPAGAGWEEGGGSFPSSSLDGDYNGNGTVDAADFTVWRDGLGGEFTLADYDVWKTNYGATAGPLTQTGQLLELRNEGLTEIGPNSSISLGTAFNTTTAANDLVFAYGVEDGNLVEGSVSYVGGGSSAASSVVPEPTSATLFGLAMLLICLRPSRILKLCS